MSILGMEEPVLTDEERKRVISARLENVVDALANGTQDGGKLSALQATAAAREVLVRAVEGWKVTGELDSHVTVEELVKAMQWLRVVTEQVTRAAQEAEAVDALVLGDGEE